MVLKEELLEANSNLASISSFLSTVGHLFSGLAIILLTVGGSILVNSISFFISGLFLLNLPQVIGGAKKSVSDRWQQIKEGFAYLTKHETLFPLALFSAAMNLALISTQSILIFSAKEVLNLTATQTALIFMVGGIFSFSATLLVKRIGKKLTKGQMIRYGSTGVLVGLFLFWVHPSLITFMIGFAILVSIAVFVMVSVTTYRQEIIPNELLGRVTASYQLFTLSTQPIAILGGGYLAHVTNIQTVFFVSFVIVAINVLVAWFGKIRHIQ